MNRNEVFCSILNSRNIDIDFININRVSMNSKEIQKNDLFVAIRGGNNYISEALKKGAYAVYDNAGAKIDDKYKDRVFYVNDSVLFLQEFAKKWRETLNLKVIGITGSNGKTTVKDITYQLLSAKYKGKKTEGNYNNHIGLPFTLLRLEKDDEFIILEMGMSGIGEIDLLGKISSPDISIITNIGESHLEFLHTKENVFKAKTEILPYTKETLIINGDDNYLKDIKNDNFRIIKVLMKKENEDKKIVNKLEKCDKRENTGNINIDRKDQEKIGKNRKYENIENFNFYYGDVKFDEKGTVFSLSYNENKDIEIQKNLKTNLPGEHNILNLTMGIAVAKQLGIDDKSIEKTVRNIKLTDMRFQIIEKKDTVYINDAYNASPASMRKSLETFSEIYNDKIKIAVLGDMLELGKKELELHSEISKTVERVRLDKIYLFGERMRSLYNTLKDNSEKESLKNKQFFYFSDKNEIKKELEKITDRKAILIKGSRGMKLEEIIG